MKKLRSLKGKQLNPIGFLRVMPKYYMTFLSCIEQNINKKNPKLFNTLHFCKC